MAGPRGAGRTGLGPRRPRREALVLRRMTEPPVAPPSSPSSRVALITGAGSGIGRAVARELAAAGWALVLAGRRTEALERTRAQIEDARAVCVAADVSDADDVERLFRTADGFAPRLDLLFNNAGTFGPGGIPFDELPLSAWQKVVGTNLTGAFLCAQAAFRRMKAQDPQGGRIINNGSVSAHVPRPGSAPYSATKHGLTGLTKSLSLDGRPFRIACGQIDVGNAATDMTQRMAHGVPQADGRLMAEPVMDVADVARTVRHMAELPLEANLQFATVLATAMPFIGRG
jgi:NAD(P)-dependent dehydrogenase (short-subunit alcohol dehydrogenase family)